MRPIIRQPEDSQNEIITVTSYAANLRCEQQYLAHQAYVTRQFLEKATDMVTVVGAWGAHWRVQRPTNPGPR